MKIYNGIKYLNIISATNIFVHWTRFCVRTPTCCFGSFFSLFCLSFKRKHDSFSMTIYWQNFFICTSETKIKFGCFSLCSVSIWKIELNIWFDFHMFHCFGCVAPIISDYFLWLRWIFDWHKQTNIKYEWQPETAIVFILKC